MIRADMIPDKAWHTAMSTYHKTIKKRPGSAWQEAIAAALSAWPEAKRVKEYFTHDTDHYEPAIILPLPQDARDERA